MRRAPGHPGAEGRCGPRQPGGGGRALADVLKADESTLFPPLIDAVVVEPGYRGGPRRRLGEDLSAPADEPAPIHWRTLEPIADAPALPFARRPLDRFRQALRRWRAGSARSASSTTPRPAANWPPISRWASGWLPATAPCGDGMALLVASGAQTAAAARLEQRNRPEGRAQPHRGRPGRGGAQAAGHLRASCALAATLGRQRSSATPATRCAAPTSPMARRCDRLADLRNGAARHESRMKALIGNRLPTVAAGSHRGRNRRARRRAPPWRRFRIRPGGHGRGDIAALRAELAELRAADSVPAPSTTAFCAKPRSGSRRLAEIERGVRLLVERGKGAEQRMSHLESVARTIDTELERLSASAAEIEAKRQALLTTIEQSEGRLRKPRTGLPRRCRKRLAEATRRPRGRSPELAHVREERVRIQRQVEQGEQAPCRGLSSSGFR